MGGLSDPFRSFQINRHLLGMVGGRGWSPVVTGGHAAWFRHTTCLSSWPWIPQSRSCHPRCLGNTSPFGQVALKILKPSPQGSCSFHLVFASKLLSTSTIKSAIAFIPSASSTSLLASTYEASAKITMSTSSVTNRFQTCSTRNKRKTWNLRYHVCLFSLRMVALAVTSSLCQALKSMKQGFLYSMYISWAQQINWLTSLATLSKSLQ